MIDKTIFDEKIGRLQVIADRYEIDILKEACQRILTVRDTFEMKVLFVGHFSAGKSSFLNELIGRHDFLQEGLDPTTARVQEIRYDKDQMSELEELKDYVLVDTPGFDSGIGEHSRALAAYLGCGGGYVVMSDIRKGDIDDLTLSFIKEIFGYTNNIAIIFSWCDQVSYENKEKILQKAKETLAAWGFDFPVHGLSRHDSDVAAQLKKIVLSFDIQKTFEARMQAAIEAEKGVFFNALKIAARHANKSTWDTERQLCELKQAKERLAETFAEKRHAIAEEFPSQVDAVMSDIRIALEEKADICADLILAQDQQALEAVMLEAVRPVLLKKATKAATSQINSLVHAMDFSSAMTIEEQKDIIEALSGTIKSANNLIETGVLGQALSVLQKEDSDKDKKKDESNKTYKAITGITAILTDVINPWAEVVIVLLPEIIGLCKAIFGVSKHDVARDRYLKRIVNVVVARLYLPMETTLREASTALLNGLNEQCAERLARFEQEIRQLDDNRSTILANNATRSANLLEDIEYVKSVKLLEA